MENLLVSVFGVAETAIQVVLGFWKIIVSWAQESLLPWIKENLRSEFHGLIKDALVVIDRVKSPLTQLVKRAWTTLRKFLAKSIITFEGKANNGKMQWIKHWTTEIYNVVNPAEPKKKVIETEEEISFEDLPKELREAWIKNQELTKSIDFIAVRDREMEELEMVA